VSSPMRSRRSQPSSTRSRTESWWAMKPSMGGLRGFDEGTQVCRLVNPASPAVEGLHREVRARVAAVSPKVPIAGPDRGRDATVSGVFLIPIPDT
jgi:hypothetical protein